MSLLLPIASFKDQHLCWRREAVLIIVILNILHCYCDFNYCWCHNHCPLHHLRHQHMTLRKRRSPHHGGSQHSLQWYCGFNTLLLLMVTVVLLQHWRHRCKEPMVCKQMRRRMLLIHLKQGEKRKCPMIHPPFALIPWGTLCSRGRSTKSRIKTWLLRMPRWY